MLGNARKKTRPDIQRAEAARASLGGDNLVSASVLTPFPQGRHKSVVAAPVCELTILMPCLNEARTIATCVRKAREFLQRTDTSGEVLIADNGSDDGSWEIAERTGARVIRVPRKGYGNAL